MNHFYFGVLIGLIAAWLHDLVTKALKNDKPVDK